MNDYVLAIEGLYGGIGNFKLVDINLEIKRGTVMGLIGKNGAGKTTLIQTITGLLPRYRGSILFNGMPMSGNEVKVKNQIGMVFDTPIYHLGSTPYSISQMISCFYTNYDTDRFHLLMKRFDLPPDKKLIKYSKGMRNTFNIVMALCHNPDLVIMDEPTAGLDPGVRRDILDILHEFMQDEGKSILFSTHITSDLERIADSITLIDYGKTIFSKSVTELSDDMALCSIAKGDLTKELKPYILGYRETSFGLECLIIDKSKFKSIPGIQFARPRIEDIVTHRSRGVLNETH